VLSLLYFFTIYKLVHHVQVETPKTAKMDVNSLPSTKQMWLQLLILDTCTYLRTEHFTSWNDTVLLAVQRHQNNQNIQTTEEGVNYLDHSQGTTCSLLASCSHPADPLLVTQLQKLWTRRPQKQRAKKALTLLPIYNKAKPTGPLLRKYYSITTEGEDTF
jgi:hypothetical protein